MLCFSTIPTTLYDIQYGVEKPTPAEIRNPESDLRAFSFIA